MTRKSFWLFLLISFHAAGQKNSSFELVSPDGNIVVTIKSGEQLHWSVKSGGRQIINPSDISLKIKGGETLGADAKIISAKKNSVNTSFKAINYFKDVITNYYNELTLTCKGNYGVIFRAYDDGVAYHFFTTKKGEVVIADEKAEFNFEDDYNSYIPRVRDFRGKEQYIQSFEALYTEKKLSEYNKDTLGFLPALIDIGDRKAVIMEADLEDYPGMFVKAGGNGKSLRGTFAPYPLDVEQGGYKKLNTMVTKRADYIAKVNGTRSFPWRAIVISEEDTALLNNDMVQRLASPSRIDDPSWIKPGKVAWDWWNDWNITHVNFRAGVNTETYKYYIDFAAKNGLEYIIIDEGWSNDLDLMDVSSKMDLQQIIDYGKEKNVGVILWAGWYAVISKMDAVFEKYAAMGAKGFKIDFMDRDDQVMVSSLYAIAKKAAEHKMIIDYHGMYKPTGMQHTWPNIINIEGVKGMENVKWTPSDDVPHYDVTLPFIRMVAGPMDYTPGAMRNATKSNFRPLNSMPMSQGTRCHQLAMYVVFFAPLQMLSDNPTAYMQEQESTDFIDSIPTTFDETVPLAGKVGEYVAIARRKGDRWYVGAMNNWDARDITIDMSFLGRGDHNAVVFSDGINADRNATDYKSEEQSISGDQKLTIHMAPGGGWAARIFK